MLLVFSLKNRLTEEEKSALFALKILFGSKIVDYMIVVFTNEDSLEDDGDTFEEYLEDSPDFKVSVMIVETSGRTFSHLASLIELCMVVGNSRAMQ